MWSMESTLLLVVVHVFVHTVTAVFPPSCTFDNGWCQWRHQNSTRFEWHLGNGSTTDRSSGPVGDHTTKYRNGSYIFIKGIEAHMNSSIKAVVEADIDVTSDLQISFWYFMNGVGIGILTLNKIDGDGSKTELWRREGRQGPEWIQATVSLPRGSFVISFEASARLFYGSDLAVDDIEIAPIRTTTNPPPSTIPPARELPFDCDFESRSCGLELVPSLGNTVGWNITSGPVSYKGKTLVSGDVSGKRGGKFLLLNEWNMGENGDTAQIISPIMENTGAACLRFYVYLATSTSGTLSVYQKLLPSMELVLLREVSYKKPPGWKSLMFTLKRAPYFQIILEGSYTDSRYYGSVIGVDDFTIKNEECVLTTTPTTTQRTSTKPSTTELKVPKTQVSISSRPETTQSSSTLPSSSSHVSSPYSTQASTTPTSLTTKRVQPSTTSSTSGSSTSKSGHTSSSYKTSSFFTTQNQNTTTNPLEISSVATNSQITTKSPSHVPWLSSIQTSKSSTLSSSVTTTTTEKETVFSSSKSSSQSSLQTYIPSRTISLLSSRQPTTLLTTKRTSRTSNIMTKTTSRPSSVTLNTAKPTSQKSNSSTLSPSSTSPGSTSVILSSLFTDVATFNFQTSSTWITTGKSERSTSGKHTSQYTSTLSSGIPKTTTSSITKALTSSHTTSLSTSSRPTSTNEVNKLAGRETTAIVLGVCLPIIALVILSVVVLICKKDHSNLNSVQDKKKVRPYKVEKSANADSIEMNDNVFVKGFRKLDT